MTSVCIISGSLVQMGTEGEKLGSSGKSTKGGKKNFHGTIRDMISSIITRAFFNLRGGTKSSSRILTARLRHVEIEDVTLSPYNEKRSEEIPFGALLPHAGVDSCFFNAKSFSCFFTTRVDLNTRNQHPFRLTNHQNLHKQKKHLIPTFPARNTLKLRPIRAFLSADDMYVSQFLANVVPNRCNCTSHG